MDGAGSRPTVRGMRNAVTPEELDLELSSMISRPARRNLPVHATCHAIWERNGKRRRPFRRAHRSLPSRPTARWHTRPLQRQDSSSIGSPDSLAPTFSISVTASTNLAARRVMEKVGLGYQGTRYWMSPDVAVVWYAIERSAWTEAPVRAPERPTPLPVPAPRWRDRSRGTGRFPSRWTRDHRTRARGRVPRA